MTAAARSISGINGRNSVRLQDQFGGEPHLFLDEILKAGFGEMTAANPSFIWKFGWDVAVFPNKMNPFHPDVHVFR